MNNYYVYIHYRNDNLEPFYVGKGIGNRHKSIKNRNKKWHDINNKFGFYSQIIKSNLSEDESLLIEKLYIKLIGKEKLCNLTSGGQGISGFKHSKQTKQKLSIFFTGYKHTSGNTKRGNSGIKNGMYGKKLSEEHKNILSETHKGKTLSQEHKNILSKTHKGKPLDTEHRKKISKALSLNNVSSKKIINIETGECFNTIKSAAESINMKPSTLYGKISGRNKNDTKFILC